MKSTGFMEILKKIRVNNNLTRNQLSKITNINEIKIREYENEPVNPPIDNVAIFSALFEYSCDYFINEGKCNWPKNLKLIKHGLKLDKKDSSHKIKIENTISTFLYRYQIDQFQHKQDLLDIDLSDNFHDNLKNLRISKNLTQDELGNDFNISKRMISGYEKNNKPPYDKLIYLAQKLEVSVHFLITGEKLLFDFKDKEFGDTILKADHFFNFDEHKILIQLMETFLNT